MRLLPHLLAIAALLLVPAHAQQKDVAAKNFSIDGAEYSDVSREFEFWGKGALPDGTVLRAYLDLSGNACPAIIVPVQEGRFHGSFPTKEREVLPGRYALHVSLGREGLPAGAPNLLGDAEIDDGICHVDHMAADGPKVAESLTAESLALIQVIRGMFDDACQTASQVQKATLAARKDGAALTPAQVDAILEPWKRVHAGTRQELLRRRAEYVERQLARIYLSPIAEAAQSIVTLLDSVVSLVSSFTIELMEGLGRGKDVTSEDRDRGRFSSRVLIGQVMGIARGIQYRLSPGKPIWAPLIDIAKERGSREGATYVSQVSGFRLDVPEGWKVVQGEEDSTLRLGCYLMNQEIFRACVEVHAVDFPWAEGKEELAQAWVRLAEYEWEKYRFKKAEFKTDAKGREYYEFSFVASLSAILGDVSVTCYLYFAPDEKHPHRVHAVMVVFPWRGLMMHHYEDELNMMLESFDLLRG